MVYPFVFVNPLFPVSVRKPARSVILSVPPRKQLVDSNDLVVGNACQNISKLGLRIDAVELRNDLSAAHFSSSYGSSLRRFQYYVRLAQKAR
jgi:hypothetical protein